MSRSEVCQTRIENDDNRKDRSVQKSAVVILVISMLLAVVAGFKRNGMIQLNFITTDTVSGQLGAEYDTIAQSVRAGRGISDPFQEPSGPTAWMPPFLPLTLAGVYAVCSDSRDTVRNFCIAMQGPVVFVCGLMVLFATRVPKMPIAVPVCFLLGATADFYELFQRTHDTQPIAICLSLLLVGIVKLWNAPISPWTAAVWGVVGGLFALTSPVTGFVWAIITTIRWLPKRSQLFSRSLKPLAVAAVVSILTISPWVLRNYYHFGRFIPIKSNLVYEIWQSQCLDDDGVLSMKAAYQHPWGSRSEQRIEYLEVGETEFLRRRWPPVIESIQKDPLDLINRIANRWFAATIYYHTFYPMDEYNYPWPLRYKRLYFALPFVSLMIILAMRRSPFPKELLAAILIYVLFLGPYILISYYDRYAAPLFAVKVILVVYGFDTLREFFARKSQPSKVKGIVDEPEVTADLEQKNDLASAVSSVVSDSKRQFRKAAWGHE